MSYYIRVLGTKDPDIHLDELLDALEADGLRAKFAVADDEKPEKWTAIEILSDKEEVLTELERNPVKKGDFGLEELEEFKETILDFKPASAAKWLNTFFDKVKVIYAFQLLDAAFEENHYPVVTAIQAAIWQKIGGILQADGEGFSNEEGYHILWQFEDDVEGGWNCAVINSKGEWENFAMELGDTTQRQEFLEGRVPASATRV
ncbi:hypothetical protein SAMN05421788_1011376 [Filimonas lacunae]|uniref:Uncharacterized protein n=1 Tax=Filimonas lacunae TaxID=477680 RepID=A0A173MQL5_9BACT|nr:hypothetical protein [Filimonas lacunae]BAV09944.1 hypothetical protein FLA_5997 [Filimonas lacunae]SIS81457.1 hypothetical protein SAMN05421788_1011376 [Filimonas lacunae]